MASEVDDLRGHYDRYRAVTLEHLQRLSDERGVRGPTSKSERVSAAFKNEVVHSLRTLR
jgi:hypothetical protein